MQTVKALSFLCVLVLLIFYADYADSNTDCTEKSSNVICGEITHTDNKQNLTWECNATTDKKIEKCEFYSKEVNYQNQSDYKVFSEGKLEQGLQTCSMNVRVNKLEKPGDYCIRASVRLTNDLNPATEQLVTLRPPSQKPVLSVTVKHSDESNQDETFNSANATISVNATVGDELTCVASGGFPPVTEYSISCELNGTLPKDSPVKLGNGKPLVLETKYDGAVCVCEASYINGWYTNNRSNEITLRVQDKPPIDIDGDEGSPHSLGKPPSDIDTVNLSLIIIVTSSVVGALAIAVIIGVIVSRVKEKRRGQMEASTQDAPTANQTAGFSQDWRNDRTLVMVDNSALYGQFTQQLKAAIKRPDETT